MTSSSQELLLAIAREAIVENLTGTISPTLARVIANPPDDLTGDEGAFVTLKKRGLEPTAPGSLRGCIGNIIGKRPLFRLVQRLACESAFHDARFRPVRLQELENLTIEISVLTVPKPVASHREIMVGRHGVILSYGFHRSVFLPQVATEQGWSKDQMLSHLAMKAGLSSDAWREEGCSFDVFEALVFGEDQTA